VEIMLLLELLTEEEMCRGSGFAILCWRICCFVAGEELILLFILFEDYCYRTVARQRKSVRSFHSILNQTLRITVLSS
jgi:hypothetical protein